MNSPSLTNQTYFKRSSIPGSNLHEKCCYGFKKGEIEKEQKYSENLPFVAKRLFEG